MQSTLDSGNKSESAVEGRAKKSRGHSSLTTMIIMTRHEAFSTERYELHKSTVLDCVMRRMPRADAVDRDFRGQSKRAEGRGFSGGSDPGCLT